MLLDLQTLDVVVRHGQTARGQDGKKPHTGLSGDRASKRPPANHQGRDIRQDAQQYHNVAVDPVEQERLEPDNGYELPDHEEPHGQATSQVNGNAYAIVATFVPIPFEGGGLIRKLPGHV